MNPLTNVKNITKLNETELASGSIHKKSWHDMYKESAWIFIGGLQYDLTEGDILAVFSQYGEIVNINLVRDKKSGNSKGFCFLCYSNQKSTVLAVDNFNGIKLCNRTIRVDHVANYKPPKEDDRDDEMTKKLKSEGCAPKLLQSHDESDAQKKKRLKKEKKEKKKKKKDKKDAVDTQRETPVLEIKQEKYDPGYEKYDSSHNRHHQHAVKIKHREKSLEKSKGETSQTYEKHRSKDDWQYNRTSKKSNTQYEDNYPNKDRLSNKVKYKESEQQKEYFKEDNKHISSSKSHKRKRSSSSSDDAIKKHSDNIRHKGENYQGYNRKHKSADYSSSSSSGSDSSSTQSSSDDEKDKHKETSDDEKDKHKNKYSRKDKYVTSGERRSYEKDNKYKRYNKSENSSYTSSKNKDYDKTKKYSEYKSKSKYQSDDSDDTDHKNHHKHRRDKR